MALARSTVQPLLIWLSCADWACIVDRLPVRDVSFAGEREVRAGVASRCRAMRCVAARCVSAHRPSGWAPRAPAICGLTRAIRGSPATRILVDTASTMYAEEVNFSSAHSALPAGLRGAAEGIERFELTSEQSDITHARRGAIGTVAGVVAARLKVRRNGLQLRECSMDIEPTNPVTVTPARYVLLPLANLITGYTVKAIQRKIERGDWQEGRVWRRAPDGRICIDLVGYEKWVESR